VGLRWKTGFFSPNLHTEPHTPCVWQCFTTLLHMLETHGSTPGACGTFFKCVFFFLFFVLFSVFFLNTCLGTWDRISLIVMSPKVSWIFIPCLPNSSWGILICWITWFFNEIHQKHLSIAWFREELELDDSIWKHYKMPLKP